MKKAKIKEAPKFVMPKAYKKFDIIKCKSRIMTNFDVDGSMGSEIIEKGFY